MSHQIENVIATSIVATWFLTFAFLFGGDPDVWDALREAAIRALQ